MFKWRQNNFGVGEGARVGMWGAVPPLYKIDLHVLRQE